ncbi:sulfate ABC transporter ATP-binding protein [Neomegalonema sp.]|uniref:sulfate/molybdate ABC transporter ATP-binding protein n=1 Tax=Neomegalonema sp. TaxID=2039713 RepID=UPI002627D3E4|nr:sulfate ABC transporter ATP-binding protein [Neomegalonema sp.]MDD2869248.1 sulfate ABC transporter ATP-binding protein [Neomegalonema sp.]
MSIRVEHINKRFGDFVALNDVTLDVPDGKLTALLGPSGCGKTTLLRVIAGLEQSDSGRILFNGEDSSNAHVRERNVGFVFQHYALFRHMTVFENVAFGLRVKPRRERLSDSEIRAKVTRLLELVHLDWLGHRYPAQLSGGQRQRIALARALAVEPRVLLLDEPFGALDAKVRKDLRRWLRDLHHQLGLTSIFVTHDQEEALELADQVVLINKGAIEQVGEPAQVYSQPATPFVQSFLGHSNFFEGRVVSGALQVEDGGLALPAGSGDEGARLSAYVRPHEFQVTRETSGPGVEAKVARALELGALARIELVGVRSGRPFEAEIPKRELAKLALVPGETVRLVPDALRVFPAQEVAAE